MGLYWIRVSLVVLTGFLSVGQLKDADALTILAQDEVVGLEVKRQSDGEWIPIYAAIDAYIINIGQIIQVLNFYNFNVFNDKIQVLNFGNIVVVMVVHNQVSQFSTV